ncbi:isobutyryl-CoA dehydrogenase, mitochondrial [Platysternon megacephalum]|uniref:Isobutyryl-CoA dehydrogenase, mitochondrial n=1 Tax=Platysternon megacephalum TaxID=55544 RepID=A0A4D9EAL8_9SAUR|nr:isobutyryl-CoA dehydrogenase, mitochondrial [Platysternon megacephalum]
MALSSTSHLCAASLCIGINTLKQPLSTPISKIHQDTKYCKSPALPTQEMPAIHERMKMPFPLYPKKRASEPPRTAAVYKILKDTFFSPVPKHGHFIHTGSL